METKDNIKCTLEFLDTNPWDDLGNLQADAEQYMIMKLSFSIIKNKVDHREPITNIEGRLNEFPLFETEFDYHLTNRASWHCDIVELCEGINFTKVFEVLAERF